MDFGAIFLPLKTEAYDELRDLQDMHDSNDDNLYMRDLIQRIRDELNKQEPKPMKFDPKLPVQLRNGCKAVILEVMEEGEFPIFGRFKPGDNRWRPSYWTISGKHAGMELVSDHDLINIPEAPEVAEFWVNVYGTSIKLPMLSAWESKASANKQAHEGRFACIKISCIKGEGL